MKSPHQHRVEQFMFLAGQEVPDRPTIPSVEIRRLRAALILEEALETIDALGFHVTEGRNLVEHVMGPNLVEIADGCADVSVVTIGTLSACGISDMLLLQVVDESNLRKFEPGSYRREDGKHMKPPGWTAPDIKGVLDEQRSDSGDS